MKATPACGRAHHMRLRVSCVYAWISTSDNQSYRCVFSNYMRPRVDIPLLVGDWVYKNCIAVRRVLPCTTTADGLEEELYS